MSKYPLIFTFKDLVRGAGFIAGVTTRGRVLMVCEGDNDWWMYGVQPGAIAASGKSPEAVYINFKQAYSKVLFDFAEECASCDDFSNRVAEFFNQTDHDEEAYWQAAAAKVRAGQVSTEAIGLSKQPKETQTMICVERLDQDGASQLRQIENDVDRCFIVSAA